MANFVMLDIDGVLNDHAKLPSHYCGIKPECRDQLNRITDETGARLVISSAWRYLILNGSMSLDGFENLLRTHGVRGNVIGYTRADTMIGDAPVADERGQQITEWIVGPGWRHYGETGRHVVLDDLDLGITAAGHTLIQTAGNVGLTAELAGRAIDFLLGGKGDLWLRSAL